MLISGISLCVQSVRYYGLVKQNALDLSKHTHMRDVAVSILKGAWRDLYQVRLVTNPEKNVKMSLTSSLYATNFSYVAFQLSK